MTVPEPSLDAFESVPREVRFADDPVTFRRIFGHFATGIIIVTAHDDTPIGLTCQSFSALSLDPPLVLFCVAHTSVTWPRIREVGAFAVNILSTSQEKVCRRFATSGGDKFESIRWTAGANGAPILEGVVAFAECQLESVYPAGDHDIVVARPTYLGENPALDPLLYLRSRYGAFVSSESA